MSTHRLSHPPTPEPTTDDAAACKISAAAPVAGAALRTLYLAVARYGCAMHAGKTRWNVAYHPWAASKPRTPGIVFFQHERYENYRRANPHYRIMPYRIVPDFVAEDWSDAAAENAALYLQDGVKIVCVLAAARREVHLYSPDHVLPPLSGTAILKLDHAIPGFGIPVAAIFAD